MHLFLNHRTISVGILSLGIVWLFAMNTILVYNLQGRSSIAAFKEDELRRKEDEISNWRRELEQVLKSKKFVDVVNKKNVFFVCRWNWNSKIVRSIGKRTKRIF